MRSRHIYWFGIRAVKDRKSSEWRRAVGPWGSWRTLPEQVMWKMERSRDGFRGRESRPSGRKLWGGGKRSCWSCMRAGINGFSSNGIIGRLLVNSYHQPFWTLSENSIDADFVEICAVQSSLKTVQNAGKIWRYHLHFHIVRWNFIL